MRITLGSLPGNLAHSPLSAVPNSVRTRGRTESLTATGSACTVKSAGQLDILTKHW